LRKRDSWSCLVGVLLAGVVGCLCWHRRHARCGGGPLRLLWSWWSAGGGCPPRVLCVWGVACCRGSGVVRPGCLACGSASLLFGGVGLWVWVGWL